MEKLKIFATGTILMQSGLLIDDLNGMADLALTTVQIIAGCVTVYFLIKNKTKNGNTP